MGCCDEQKSPWTTILLLETMEFETVDKGPIVRYNALMVVMDTYGYTYGYLWMLMDAYGYFWILVVATNHGSYGS